MKHLCFGCREKAGVHLDSGQWWCENCYKFLRYDDFNCPFQINWQIEKGTRKTNWLEIIFSVGLAFVVAVIWALIICIFI